MSENATLYYERPVLLDRAKHRGWRVKPSGGFAFARNANSVALAGVEFTDAMKEYPIVFTRMGSNKIVPVAMLGLRSRENLFVNQDGRWAANYIPAFVRRYPFVLAQLADGKLGLCIDEAYAGLSQTEGEPLFDEEGGNTPTLANALDFLKRYQGEFGRTEAFCQRLEQAGLLREMNAKADLKDGRSFTVSGMLVVDEAKLKALPDATALSFLRSGETHLISLHLASLPNMHRLVDKVSAVGDAKAEAADKGGKPQATPAGKGGKPA